MAAASVSTLSITHPARADTPSRPSLSTNRPIVTEVDPLRALEVSRQRRMSRGASLPREPQITPGAPKVHSIADTQTSQTAGVSLGNDKRLSTPGSRGPRHHVVRPATRSD
jgi:hypothetical protein